jgi:hypothetical protein
MDKLRRIYQASVIFTIPMMFSCGGGGGSDTIPAFTLFSGIAIADLNGDTRPDVVTSNIFIDSSPPHPGHVTVSIQQATTAGVFGNGVDYAVGPDPWHVAADDLNNDGRIDLMATSTEGDSLTLLQQSEARSGVFLPLATLPVADHPQGVVGADINGDGFNDIAVTGAYLALLLNTPGNPGTFIDGGTISVNSVIESVAAGDIDGDGRIDLAVDGPAGDVLVFLQDPAPAPPGSFSGMAGYFAGSRQIDVELADLDGDSKLDLVVTLHGTSSTDAASRVSVLIQNHDPAARGQFLPAVSYPTGKNSWNSAVGDLNQDGLPDLAVANSLGKGVSILLQGEVPGEFQNATNLFTNYGSAESGSKSVAIGDLNEDGFNDIALSDHTGAVVLFQNSQSPGTFLSPRIIDE